MFTQPILDFYASFLFCCFVPYLALFVIYNWVVFPCVLEMLLKVAVFLLFLSKLLRGYLSIYANERNNVVQHFYILAKILG